MEQENLENKEIELKIALASFVDYLKLIGYIGNADAKIYQTNIFYDSADKQVSKLGYAFRLRIEQDRAIVTLKSTTAHVGDAAVRTEIEKFLSIEMGKELQETSDFHLIDMPAIQLLQSKKVKIGDLKPLLQFENERFKKKIELHSRNYIFEIDKTTYSDSTIIYELEIELATTDEIENAVSDVQQLFKSLDIEFELMKKSKFERALEIAQLK